MKSNRTRAVVFTLTTALLLPWIGRTLFSAEPEDKPFEPVVGQGGKDVIWVPTTDPLVAKMLDLTKVTDKDYVVDLGSGDGRIVIAAAKRGARALGIEYKPEMVELLEEERREGGRLRQGDLPEGRPLRNRLQQGHRRDAVPAARVEPQAAAEDPQDETGHPRGLARLRHG